MINDVALKWAIAIEVEKCLPKALLHLANLTDPANVFRVGLDKVDSRNIRNGLTLVFEKPIVKRGGAIFSRIHTDNPTHVHSHVITLLLLEAYILLFLHMDCDAVLTKVIDAKDR